MTGEIITECLSSGWSFDKSMTSSGTKQTSPYPGSRCTVVLSATDDVSQKKLNAVAQNLDSRLILQIGCANSNLLETLEECLQTMMYGETCDIIIRSPEGTIFKYNLHLDSFDTVLASWQMTPKEKYDQAKLYKEQGTQLFKENNIEFAFKNYSKALKLFICIQNIFQDDLKLDCDSLRCACYLNLAACQLKYQNYNHVITNCSKALDIQSKNVKALYRRGVAYIKRKQYDDAVQDLRKGIELEPSNKQVKKELDNALYRQKEESGSLGTRLKAMFM